MTPEATTPAKKPSNRRPKIIIDADQLAHIEGLAEGARHRNPELSDRLLDELGRASIIPTAKMPANVVTIGSTVTYRDDGNGQEKSATLVYPEDADISKLRVSVMTPIGVALLGLTEGASFHWDTRDHQRRVLTVTRVEPPVADK